MTPPEPKLWLDRVVSRQESGHFRFKGDRGADPVIVELDRSAADSEEAALAMHTLVQETARRMWSEGRAFEIYPDGPDGKRHWIIGITQEDLAETRQA